MGDISARDLIVDVGMSSGEDTRFYLEKGFKVLAIEAVPELAARGEQMFAEAVSSGDLVIENVAVADHDGEIDFFVSTYDGWSSTREDMAGRFGYGERKITVPCTTLDKLLAPYDAPYYVKIDIEGGDRACVEALGRLDEKPDFVSFEADFSSPENTDRMVDLLLDYGYTRFKLVNQAVHPRRRLPNPPLEGTYVDARFTKLSSGPFGNESPGPWREADAVREQFHDTVRQHAAYVEYTLHGTVFGIRLGRLHAPLAKLYNLKPVEWARTKYADLRGIESGGWFDIHAAR